MSPDQDYRALQTRRQFLGRGSLGVGAAALGSLLNRDAPAALRQIAPEAKRVIYLFHNGAPSHVELFDNKPRLRELHGQPFPSSLTDGKRFSTMTSGQEKFCLGSITSFARHGRCGMELGSYLPFTAGIADKICLVRSMHTTQVNHAPAITFFLTGAERPGRPSMGAWLTYGLGAESDDLPGFVCMTSIDQQRSCGQIFYEHYWGSGFLPSVHQGVKFRGTGDPVLYLSNPDGLSRQTRRGMLDDLAELNLRQFESVGDPEILTRISQYEMAYRMQASVPELTDLSSEPQAVLDLYGPDVQRKGSYAYNCLMARRLVERGTRFVQLMHSGWDQHRNLNSQFAIQCRDTDQPSAGLVRDLDQRGLLDDTLVIWGGEFGRTPFLQGKMGETKQWGRDHHPYAFSLWMAGGGVKPGLVYGATDEFGFNVTENPVHVHDFQATVLHLLGIDHERLTYRYQGRRFRLTDVHGHVVREILA